MKMRTESREERLGKYRRWYARRDKEGKGRLLDELCTDYGYSRKHAIKLLRSGPAAAPGRRGCGRVGRYEPIREIVERIWRAAEQACGKRLVALLPLWLPHYCRHFGALLPTQLKLLREVSAATLDRLLAPRRHARSHGLSGTRPGTLLRQQIPIQGEVWDEHRPGFLEADSVAHCGDSLAGSFVWSLTYTDLATAWTAGRAVWNKGWEGVLEQTRQVEASLPFRLLGFDFDNGGEWLNWHLVRYLQLRPRPVRITRSRPYHKDDNAHVEQKNWMWPRQLLGYGRIEDPRLVAPINALYRDVWEPLQNGFLPSMKLKHKWRDGSRWIRQHDRPQTALQRVLANPLVDARTKRQLRDRYAALDPFLLAREIERRLRPILALSPALSPPNPHTPLPRPHPSHGVIPVEATYPSFNALHGVILT